MVARDSDQYNLLTTQYNITGKPDIFYSEGLDELTQDFQTLKNGGERAVVLVCSIDFLTKFKHLIGGWNEKSIKDNIILSAKTMEEWVAAMNTTLTYKKGCLIINYDPTIPIN